MDDPNAGRFILALVLPKLTLLPKVLVAPNPLLPKVLVAPKLLVEPKPDVVELEKLDVVAAPKAEVLPNPELLLPKRPEEGAPVVFPKLNIPAGGAAEPPIAGEEVAGVDEEILYFFSKFVINSFSLP